MGELVQARSQPREALPRGLIRGLEPARRAAEECFLCEGGDAVHESVLVPRGDQPSSAPVTHRSHLAAWCAGGFAWGLLAGPVLVLAALAVGPIPNVHVDAEVPFGILVVAPGLVLMLARKWRRLGAIVIAGAAVGAACAVATLAWFVSQPWVEAPQ